MNHMNKEDYVARISCATPLQLVIITYDLILQNMEQAKSSKNNHDGEMHAYRAHQFLLNLMESLDMNVAISKNLMSIYIYVNKLILTAKLDFSFDKRDKALALLEEGGKIMRTLLMGWESLDSKQETREKVMENAQQLYAGLTYKNGQLEEYIDTSPARGFKA